ncbi:MAG: DUF169 domain-containing protein [Candidatus Aminicenantes bacterium]|nr:DUF169 domain-containing protein [Candidatus Aminicenantes bacterium]
MKDIQLELAKLSNRINLNTPVIGLYDAPHPEPFKPLITPKKRECVFSFYKNWVKGDTLHITKSHYGCGGAGHWLWGIETRSKKDFISFLVDEEGLKASHKLMEKWIDSTQPYQADYSHLMIGPLKGGQWEFIKTITFFVNPDQLSTLMIGAQYNSAPADPTPVLAPFGSGCMELQPFKDLSIAQASIGATDIAMRQHLPHDILTFTVTTSMFTKLCELDERSFLYKSFLQRLKEAREMSHL